MAYKNEEESALPTMEEALLNLTDSQFDELLSELVADYERNAKSLRFANQRPFFGIAKSESKQDECGAGSSGGGGFQPGNTCASGGSTGPSNAGSAPGGSNAVPKPENAAAGNSGASGGTLAGKPKPERWNTENDAVDTAAKKGGFTFSPKTGKAPTTGFAVSIFPEHERKLDMDKLTQDELDKYREDTRSAWEKDDKVHLGGWHNAGEDGKFYLDASKVVDTKEEAIKLGKEHGQLAGYDIEKGEVFEIMTREERDAYEKRKADIATSAIRSEKTTQTENGAVAYNPRVDADDNGDGVTDAARVGVPAHVVPPPPEVPRLPNLNPQERHVEERFARTFEQYPDEMASAYTEIVKNSDKPNTFETDGAKKLSSAWNDSDKNKQAEKRGRYNLALHQTANGIAKRAFQMHLETLPKGSEILVTVGGCGAGKGFALNNVAEVSGLSKASAAVWDSAGDQNATENTWVQELADKHGHKVTYVYVHADPYVAWADPDRGVVKRANDPKDGRMVDASVFADSYDLGAKNFKAFHDTHKENPNVNFVFIDSSKGKPKKVDSLPPEALQVDRARLRQFAATTVANRPVAPRVKRGALTGSRVWKDNE
jgi:hypothetical protein